MVPQEYAVRTLSKERPTGDVRKLEDFEMAVNELDSAWKMFTALRTLPTARVRIEPKKLDTHIKFCDETHKKARVRCCPSTILLGLRYWTPEGKIRG